MTETQRPASFPPASDREIFAIRILDAPRKLVYEAWTDPNQVAQWWGPNGFTNTIHEMDVRAGGVFRLTMHGPDGRDYPNKITFRKVVENERLEYDHHGDTDESDHHFKATVLFEEVGGKTKLSMLMVFPTAEERNKVAEEYGAVEGLLQHLGRLAAFIGTK
jgi:uncharacterized protein YndB with AHSA1/START domain